MKFNSGKGFIVIAVIIFLIIMAIISFSDKAYVVFFVLITMLSYFVWMWYDTYYLIAGDQLIYKSALIKGSISIITISEVVKNKKLYSGLKPSLSGKGVVIKYNKWDDIYISPADIDQFIDALKNVNPNIKTTE